MIQKLTAGVGPILHEVGKLVGRKFSRVMLHIDDVKLPRITQNKTQITSR